MTTLTNVNKPKILILDSNSVAQDITANPTSDASPKVNPLRLAVMCCDRIGAYYETAHTDTLSAEQKAFSWDLIWAPCIDDATGNNYVNFETAINAFTDTTIPVAVMQAVAPALSGAVQAITGCGAEAGTVTTSCDTFDWQGRSLTKMHLYGEAAVIASLNANATPLFHDSTNAPVWQFDIGTHPTLWCAGYGGSLTTGANSCNSRPWLSLQWMVDQQSTEAKKATLRQNIRKSYSIMLFSMAESAADTTAYGAGTIQSAYDGLVAGGLKEIALCLTHNGNQTVGTVDPDLMSYWLARTTENGGIIRASNHVSDFADGSLPGSVTCTTDGAAFDNFANAEANYEAKCDEITDFGFTLGTDGYGAGYLQIQDANNMNNPSAKFCANYGMHPWININTAYPVGGASVEANKSRKPYSHNWNGIRTYSVTGKLDGISYTPTAVAGTAGMVYVTAFVYSAGMYLHSPRLTDFTQYTDDYTSQFLSAPDIWDSGTWEDCLVTLERGNTANILI